MAKIKSQSVHKAKKFSNVKNGKVKTKLKNSGKKMKKLPKSHLIQPKQFKVSQDEFPDEELNFENERDVEESDVSESEGEIINDKDEAEKHKKDLEKLKQSDPKFYNFLQENDKKLLQFHLSDEETENIEKEEKVHKPGRNLDVASDESDYEAEDDIPRARDGRVITPKMLKSWQNDIRTDKTNKTILAVSQAFHAALLRISNDETDDELVHYKVEGAAVFNGVVQLCVLELGPAIRRYLGLQEDSKQPPHKCKKFVKVKKLLKLYFTDLLKLLLGVTSSNIQTVLLKHLHYMSHLLVSYSSISKSLIKQLIHLWGTAEDSVRVLAFFCILRITNDQRASLLNTVLKSMYMTYVKNSKFVSLKTLAVTNFMRRSLVELYALDSNVSYEHVFLYIRQLAIHLRNAIMVKKTENIQTVYNWQFVNSLKLWGNLLAVTHSRPIMQQLLYPFVQVCLGTIKLVPTSQYYPLRFHVVEILADLEKETGVYIPVLPFILEILTTFDFDKKHQKLSMKPMHFTCLLRLSKSQLQENGFKDILIETIYGQLLEYLTAHSCDLAFPDLTVLCKHQIRLFLKRCRNINYSRKLKQILEKIEQNCQFIESERAKLTVNITDQKKIEGWESQIKNRGTPLATFYESWNKLRTIKKNKMLTNNEELGDYKLPTINKVKRVKERSNGPLELFPSDSEEEEGETSKLRRGKRGGKKFRKVIEDETGPVVDDDGKQDIVEDIDIDEW